MRDWFSSKDIPRKSFPVVSIIPSVEVMFFSPVKIPLNSLCVCATMTTGKTVLGAYVIWPKGSNRLKPSNPRVVKFSELHTTCF